MGRDQAVLTGGAREIRNQRSLDNQQRQLAGRPRLADPRHIANRSRRAGIEHEQRLDAPLLDLLTERRDIWTPVRRCFDREAHVAGAIDVRCVDRRHLELRVCRLGFFARAPADRHAVFGRAQRGAEPSDEEQLLE